MEQKAQVCPKCGGQMEEGFLMDRAHGRRDVGLWVKGPPQPSWLGGVKISGKVVHWVRSFRCVNCGFLESYAPEGAY